MVVEYKTKTGRTNKGVATNWLKNKLISDNGHKSTVPMYIRKSQFRLPFKATNPVIMIGPGTGIAPFMGFIQERGWLKQQGAYHSCVSGRGRTLICLLSTSGESSKKKIKTNSFFLRTGKEVGETVMFFGCRYKNEDYIYQEELEEAEKNQVLTQLHVAFSRDQEQKVKMADIIPPSLSLKL